MQQSAASPASSASLSDPHHHQAPACPLLQLPPELLRLIWDSLFERHMPPGNQHQHALRSTCKAAMHATTALITALDIKTQAATVQAAEAQGLAQIACCPSGAMLRTLRWSHWDGAGGHAQPHSVLLPALPSCLFHARSRLSAVQTVDLSGHAAFTCGELSCISDLCPQLQTLRIHDAPLIGPAFLPLSRLLHLRDLSIERVLLPHGTSCVGASLGRLPHLQRLSVIYGAVDVPHQAVLHLEDVLPHLHDLPSLRALTLELPRRDPADANTLLHLASLTHLSSLYLRLGLGTELSSRDLFGLSFTSHLTSLFLPGSTLDTSATLLLAALPKLTTLTAHHIDLDRDLSDLACGWTTLTLDWCKSLRQLLWLPLASVTELHGAQFNGSEPFEWLLDASDDVAATTSTLRRAIELLAHKAPSANSLSLQWDSQPPPSHLSVLSALALLAASHARFSLHLGPGFAACAETVQQLAQHLPSLQVLEVHRMSTGLSLAAFVAAAGRGLPRLSLLVVGCCPSELLLQPNAADREALVQMASERARSGRALEVRVSRAAHQRKPAGELYNSFLQRQGKGQVKFFFFA